MKRALCFFLFFLLCPTPATASSPELRIESYRQEMDYLLNELQGHRSRIFEIQERIETLFVELCDADATIDLLPGCEGSMGDSVDEWRDEK